MTDFDKRVLQWLDTSTCSDKSKNTMCQRINIGMNSYKTLDADNTCKLQDRKNPVQVDFTLQDSISKALRRMQEGPLEQGTVLFPHLKKGVWQPAPVMTSGSSVRSSSASASVNRRTATPGTTPRTALSSSNTAARTQASQARTATATKKSGTTSTEPPQARSEEAQALTTFSFGEPGEKQSGGDDADALGGSHNANDNSQIMDEKEDMRRRLTIFKRTSRHAISAEVIDAATAKSFEAKSVPKPPDVIKRLVKVLEGHHLFMHLDDPDLKTIAEMMKMRTLKRAEKITIKGKDLPGIAVVVAGSLVVTSSPDNKKLNVGATVGDIGLMYSSEAEEDVEAAVANTQICTLDRTEYQLICSKASQEKRQRYEGFLSQVKFLGGLTPGELLQLADSLKSAKYKKGEYLIKYGEEGNWFSIILEGTVSVIGRDAKGEPVPVCTFKEGDCVGELEFLFNHKTVADCVASSDNLRTAKMHHVHFEKVIGSAKEVLERQANDSSVYTYYRNKRKEVFKETGDASPHPADK